jgi:hypothetical protein
VKHLKLILWSSVLVAACLPAQAQDFVRVKVPFEFTAGTKHFSAGDYLFSKALPNNDIGWMIRNVVTGEGAMIGTNSVQSPLVEQTPGVQFHYSEGEYALYQVWPDGHEGRVAMNSKSKAERNRVAQAETVVIAATKGN